MENVDDVTNLRQSSATFIANKGDFDVALALNAPHANSKCLNDTPQISKCATKRCILVFS